MEHTEMLEKIWEYQEPHADGVQFPILYGRGEPDGNWRIYFTLTRGGDPLANPIVQEGSLTLPEAIERAYHKLFDIGRWGPHQKKETPQ